MCIRDCYGADIWLKREDLSPVRSYKLRGAFNAMRKLPEQKDFVCASAGNHAQGFAVSCSLLGYHGIVFMPKTTPSLKVKLVKKFAVKNVKIKLTGENFSEAYKSAQDYCSKNRKTFIHPFDDIKVIEGQATLFLEVIRQVKNPIDYIFIPIGGGGLISGAINIFKQLSPKTKIIGIEPAGAPSMKESIIKNKIIKLHKIDNFVRYNVKKYPKIAKLVTDKLIKLKEIPIVVYCYSKTCSSAGNMIELLLQEGYTNIIEYPGGRVLSNSLKFSSKYCSVV